MKIDEQKPTEKGLEYLIQHKTGLMIGDASMQITEDGKHIVVSYK